MIKLTKYDGMIVYVNPLHIVSLERSQTAHAKTFVWLSNGQGIDIKEQPVHILQHYSDVEHRVKNLMKKQ